MLIQDKEKQKEKEKDKAAASMVDLRAAKEKPPEKEVKSDPTSPVLDVKIELPGTIRPNVT